MKSAASLPRRKSRLNHWTAFDTVVTIIAIFACFITIYPMWYVIAMSLSDPIAAGSGAVTFWPVGFSIESYKIVGLDKEFWRAFLNSIFYVIVGVVLMLFNTIAIAYPLTRKNLWGRKWLTYFLLIPMYFGGGMIPSFIVVTKLGLYNSPLSLILPGCYSIMNIILCRTFLLSLPQELSEAAFLDGATNLQALWKIYLPLSKPIIAVISIYTIAGVWNSWFGASIYTTDTSIQPVQLFLHEAQLDDVLPGYHLSGRVHLLVAFGIVAEVLRFVLCHFDTPPHARTWRVFSCVPLSVPRAGAYSSPSPGGQLAVGVEKISFCAIRISLRDRRVAIVA